MNKIDLNNLDKSSWSIFRFDQIASSISERIDPNDTDLKYYIGLEHLDSENIHITRMGSPDDVNGQKLRCYPGDVIFGRRRAYQRKAAVCAVEGFCSAHSLVLRANPEIIDPQLFPFFLHSDAFMHRALDISVGSLSPTINWGTLKKQEFHLPPKDQQAKLAELLWSMDEVIEEAKRVLEKNHILMIVSRKKQFEKNDGENLRIKDVAKVRAGMGFPLKYQGKKYEKYNFYKVADMNSLGNERYLVESEHTISEDILCELKGRAHKAGTIVFPKVGAAIATEKKRILKEESIVDNNIMGVTIEDEDLSPVYLHEFFQNISLQCLANNGTVPSINSKIVEDIPFCKPKPSVLKEYVIRIEAIHRVEKSIKRKIISANILKKSLISQVF